MLAERLPRSSTTVLENLSVLTIWYYVNEYGEITIFHKTLCFIN